MATRVVERTQTEIDADVARALLLWARQHRIVVSEITVGAVRLAVADVAMAASTFKAPSREDADNLYRKFGGDLIEKIEKELDEDSTYEDEDDEEPSDPPPSRSRSSPRGGSGRAPRRG